MDSLSIGQVAKRAGSLADRVLQLIGQQQMADRGDVFATQIESLFDGSRQLLVAELATHADDVTMARVPGWRPCRSIICSQIRS